LIHIGRLFPDPVWQRPIYSAYHRGYSAILFISTLTMAGGGLILFFLAFPQFFAGSRWGKLLNGTGSASGVMTKAALGY